MLMEFKRPLLMYDNFEGICIAKNFKKIHENPLYEKPMQ